MRSGWLFVVLVGCGDPLPAQTTVAVENAGDATVSVTLVAGDQSEVFPDVAAGTSSEARAVSWDTLTAVTVTIDAGTAEPGEVDLSDGFDNVVIVGPDAPAADVREPDPAPSMGGW